MMLFIRPVIFPLTLLLLSLFASSTATAAEPVRVGILGIDNYQCLAFTQKWHKPPEDNPDLAGLKVVAAWKGGSPNLPETLEDVEKWAPHLIKLGVTIEDSIDAVLAKCDAVMVMTADGRTHLKITEQALKAGKPTYIGRPMAASLEDVIAIFDLAKKYDTPVFSCSQHRYSPGFIGMRNHPDVGEVIGCNVFGGCPTVEHHPDLFWHAVHSFDTMYTIMGPGAVSVTRARTDDTELITGVWKDGRIGSYRGIRRGKLKYSATVFGDKGVAPAGIYGYAAPVKGVVPKGRYMGYEGVATEIAKFYKTRKLPIEPSETIELFGFMEAAHESHRRGGVPVRIDEVITKARKNLAARK
jgi:predicted dehydrogenase